ncbi:MAG: GxxExxY protein [Deltaproteobacteria bacterium]|nr:GxxExxY protein [Deltaproteobacteria bacterium]
MTFNPLSEKEERIARKIVDAAYAVHKTLGPGLLEKVYEVCFCHELSKREVQYQRQVGIPIIYDQQFTYKLQKHSLSLDACLCAMPAPLRGRQVSARRQGRGLG